MQIILSEDLGTTLKYKMAASDYLNEMKRYFENNSRTKDFVAHTAKVSTEKSHFLRYAVLFAKYMRLLLVCSGSVQSKGYRKLSRFSPGSFCSVEL